MRTGGILPGCNQILRSRASGCACSERALPQDDIAGEVVHHTQIVNTATSGGAPSRTGTTDVPIPRDTNSGTAPGS